MPVLPQSDRHEQHPELLGDAGDHLSAGVRTMLSDRKNKTGAGVVRNEVTQI